MENCKQLILDCIDGKRLSQNKLYAFFAPRMFVVCLRYSKNKEEGEEILQEGFVQVFKSLHTFKNEGSFEGWIRKIMVYCAIQHYRRKPKMHPVVKIENAELEETGADDIMGMLHKKELLKMVQSLPPAYRMVFNLYVFEGMKHREIAELLHISDGTSKSNLFDAKIILQKSVANSLKVYRQNY